MSTHKKETEIEELPQLAAVEEPRTIGLHDRIVYRDKFSNKEATAFAQSMNQDGTVNLVALVASEQPPCVYVQGVPYSKEKKPGSWHWVGE